MKRLAVCVALPIMVTGLSAQGLNPGTQTKDDWEEINFEFDSAVLSDGYPSLLRLAELLMQHRDYRVRVTGNTDDVGAVAFNERLGLARANAVRDFLIKYGAADTQITTATQGKTAPSVSNTTREGRFINRRVTLLVADGQGRTVKEGGIREVINAIPPAPQTAAPGASDCCNDVRRQLDKLDDILSALKNLQGENQKLRDELADLKNQQNNIRDQVIGLPRNIPAPPPMPAVPSASDIANEIQRRNQKFSLVGINVGPSYGPNRFGNGDFTASGRAQFFSPFGDGTHAIQAQGEYMYYPGRQEGQFDIGLVERVGSFQVGAFGSFKGMTFREYQHPGFLGEGAFLADYIFSRGRVGGYATAGFKNDAVLNSTALNAYEFLQTYAHVANQYGVNLLFGLWGDAYVQANAGYVRLRAADDMPGALIKLVQPFSEKISFTLEAGLNETYMSSDKGRIVAGLEFGNYIRPKEYANVKTPVPMDVPRIRYQLLTRRVGNSPPVADAGPNQTGVAAGTITLNGSGSYDPDGGTLTYSWQQITGPSVAISNSNAAVATFPAAPNQTYYFRLTVKDSAGLQASATTTVTTGAGIGVQITSFTASPTNIDAGQQATLSWTVAGASSVSISPGIGNVNPQSGSTQVSPQQTTTYTLTANGPGGSVNATAIVSVGGGTPPQIIRFEASPLTIQPGQQSTLSWATNGASQVAISGVGAVTANGSTTVSPQQTTTYTLSVTGTNGQTVTSPVTVTVAAGALPQVATFVVTPSAITAGQSTQLCWKVVNATSISITPGVGTNLNGNDCASVSPSQTTTYTLTAVNASGQIQANTTVTVGQVQIISFTANPPTSMAAGAPVTLSWTTTNATSVILTGADIPPQTLPVNGSLVVNPITNSTYTLTAYGAGGQTVSATISEFVR